VTTTVGPATGTEREQTRARYPSDEGYVERDGVRVFWERYGDGEQTILFLPTWSLVHSRIWKGQLPYFSRHARVLTFDARGNGRSDRPRDPAAYDHAELVQDALDVLNRNAAEPTAVVSLSVGAQTALLLAGEHPERVERLVFLSPALPLGHPLPEQTIHSFDEILDTDEGWARMNRFYWRRDWRGFAEFFFSRVFTEPHSSKAVEDAVGWALETDAETMLVEARRRRFSTDEILALCARISCPSVVVEGADNAVTGPSRGIELAKALACPLVMLEGSGHAPEVRDPVRVNRLLRDFLIPPKPPERWARGRVRPKRALYVSSPIGLGHARRDLAIADELRKLHPDLEIDWLAQHPVTAILQAGGERIHPASAQLANESHHIARESAGHELNVFEAWRRMDEIFVHNFMIFHDLVEHEHYDVWIGDEAWELDYYLHENPELKRAPYVWLTDFVGWAPMPEGGEREARLTADYNAEMIAHIERFPWLRDRAVFIGDPEDVVEQPFGPSLPGIREWTEKHYQFAGYVTGFDAAAVEDRGALRAELGFASEETVCVVAVGGSGVGEDLLRLAIDAHSEALEHLPALRTVVVAGPRINPDSLPSVAALEVRGFVDDLYRHLVACDLAVVQGGLTTCMELTAARRPFLYFPLRRHCEQRVHVRHRLDRYRAGQCIEFETATPAALAAAIVEQSGRQVDYRPVEADGAARAAALIAEVIQ
jgi:pimeloyl-ACP methyl ester carboxylesterase/predicted glycosyltransferase